MSTNRLLRGLAPATSLLCATLLFPACGAPILSAAEPVAEAAVESHTERLHRLFDAEWQRQLDQDPVFASWMGDLHNAAAWPDVSLAAIATRHQQDQDALATLRDIDRSQLSATDRVSYELFEREYSLKVEGHQFGWHLAPLNQRGGIQDESSLADAMTFDSVRSLEDWIARLNAFPAYMDQTLALMSEGIRRRVIHARVVMDRVPAQIERQIVDDPEQSLFYKPFKDMPQSISPAEQARLREDARAAISQHVVPSFRKMLAFFNNEYLPACSEKVGVWQFERGQEFYAHQARSFTTTDLSPAEIHQIGLDEVARIRQEMEQVIRQVQFEGSFAEFLEHLRTDPRFYYKDANELLADYRATCMRINPQLVKLFHHLPRMPYGVEPIPEHLAPDTTTAYYRQPSADGLRPGTYFVNLYRPEVRPKYEIEVLSVHESVPGHHLQIALAMELDGIPEFRRYGGYTAYIEGWALYSESLGADLGLYSDPYSRFGQLTYDMWRAVRLVVDTGIHSMGWTRQQAIDFFAANAAKSLHDIENEIDRYIAWPGQALAYKIGQLKIRELRTRAEQRLGDRFDIRGFHGTVLSQGAVTLNVLDRIVEEWIVEQERQQ